MAEKFILTAQLRVQAPQNLEQVYNRLQSQLKNVTANIDFKISKDVEKRLVDISKATTNATNAFTCLNNSAKAIKGSLSTANTDINRAVNTTNQLGVSSNKTAQSLNKLGNAGALAHAQLTGNVSAAKNLSANFNAMARSANNAAASIKKLNTANLNINQMLGAQAKPHVGAAPKHGIEAMLSGQAGAQTKPGAAKEYMERMKQSMRTINSQGPKAQKTISGIAKSTQTASAAAHEFGAQSALAIRRFLAFSIPAGMVLSLTVGIKQAISAAVDFERQMIKVQQVTGRTRSGISGLTDSIGELSSSIGVSSAELVDVSRILSQTGLAAKDVKTALAAIARSDLAPTFENMAQTAEGAVAMFRQFDIGAGELEGKLGSLNAIAGSFAVESNDLIQAIQRAGGAFKASGGSLEELLALFTSVRATTRESAQSIATGFRTIFTRIQRPRTIKFLRQFGIELQTLSGQFVGPYEAINRLNSALANLDPRDERFSRIVEQLGGFRQVSKVIPLVQQFGTSQRALSVAMAGTNSIMEDAEKAQQSLSVQIIKLKEQYLTLFRDITSTNTFQVLTKHAVEFASSIADILKQMKEVIPLLTAAFGFRGVVGASAFGRGFFGKMTKYATGGKVAGSGSGDTVPAMLTPGEFVINKKTAEKIGYGRLEKINNVQKFARGGRVGHPAAGIGSIGSINAMVGVSIVSLLVRQLTEAESKTREWTDTISSSVIKIQLFSAAISAASRFLPGIMKSMRGFSVGSGSNLQRAWSGGVINYGRRMRTQPLGRGGRLWSSINQSSKALTGFSASVVGLTSLFAGLAVVGNIVGNAWQKAARESVDATKTQKEINQLQKEYRRGSMLKAGGTGAALGAGIGAMFGPIGMAVGGALGGIGGLIYGAFQDGSKEITQAWRQARFEKISANMSRIADEIAKGTRGVGAVGLYTGDVRRTRELAIEAGVAGEADEAKQYRKELQNQIPALIDMKTMMIESSDSVEEFLNAFGDSGRIIVSELARLTHTTTSRLIKSIEESIKKRKEEEKQIDKMNAFRRSMFDNILSLQSMNKSIGTVNDEMDKFAYNLDNAFSMGGGSFFDTGIAPQANQIGRITSGRANIGLLTTQLRGLFGDSNTQLQSFLTDSARAIQQVPTMINDAINASSLSQGMPLTAELREIFKQDGLLGSDATKGQEAVANAVIGYIGDIVDNRQAGRDDFVRKFRASPSTVIEEMMGNAFAGVIKGIEEYNEQIRSATDKYRSISNKRNEFEAKILQERLKLLQMRGEGAATLFNRRNPLRRFGRPSFESGAFVSQQRMLGGNIGMNPRALGERLRELQEKISEAENNMPTFGSEGFVKAEQSLNDMKSEAARVSTALKNLADNTTRLSAVQDELARMEEARKENFDFLIRYQFSDRGERVQMNRTLAMIGKLTTGALNIEDIPGQFRKEILALVQSMPEGPSTILGGKTVREWLFDVMRGGGLFGQDALRKSDPRGKMIPKAEQRVRDEEEKILKSMQEAQMEIIKSMETFGAGNDKFANSVDKFVAGVEKDIQERAFGEEARRLIKQREREEAKRADVGGQLERRKDVLGIFHGMNEKQITRALRSAESLIGPDSVLYALTQAKTGIRQSASRANIPSLFGGKTKYESISRVRPIGPGPASAMTLRTFSDEQREGSRRVQLADKENFAAKLESYLYGVADDDFQKIFQSLPKELRDKLQEQIEEAIGKEEVKTVGDINKEINKIISSFLGEIEKSIGTQRTQARYAMFGREDKFKNLFKEITRTTDAMEKFVKLSEGFGDFGKTTQNLQDELSKLASNIETINSRLDIIGTKAPAVVPPAHRPAKGGSIHGRRGTDTVPAMLTPGEFVVNRRATQQNRSLLEAINSGSATVGRNGIMYAARGGLTREEILSQRRSAYQQEMQRRRDAYAARKTGSGDRFAKYRRRREQAISVGVKAGYSRDRRIAKIALNAAAGRGLSEDDRDFISTLTNTQRERGSALFQQYRRNYELNNKDKIKKTQKDILLSNRIATKASPILKPKLTPNLQPESRQSIDHSLSSNLSSIATSRQFDTYSHVYDMRPNRDEWPRHYPKPQSIQQSTIRRSDLSKPNIGRGLVPDDLGVPSQPIDITRQEIDNYRNRLGLNNLPFDVSIQKFTRKRSEALRKSKGLGFNPVGSFLLNKDFDGRGDIGTLSVANNPKYWEKDIDKLKLLARHEFGHALDYYLGSKTGNDKYNTVSENPNHPLNKWLNNPKNTSRWQQALIEKRLGDYTGKDRKARATRFLKSYHGTNPKEIFAQVFAGDTPQLNKLRDEMLKTLSIHKYHSGGMVSGSGDQLAVLQGGEFVLNRKSVQALAKGGMVQGYQDGGQVSTNAGVNGGMANILLVMSEETKGKMSEFNNNLSSFVNNFSAAFSAANTSLSDTIGGLPTAFESSSSIIRDASNTFEASIVTLQNIGVGENITSAFENGTNNLVSGLNNSFNIFSSSINSLNSTAELLSNTLNNFNTSATLIDGAAKQMKDALAQDIQINVNHNHGTITLQLENGGGTAGDIGNFEQKVMEVVGPEIDRMKNRMRNYGPGIA